MLTTAAITLVAGAVCLLVTAAFIFRDRIAQYYFALRSSSIPWIVGATVIFYYSVSGCAYNIATQAPLFEVDPKTLKWTFVAPGGSAQFVFEGLFVGAMHLSCAAAIVIAARATQLTERRCPGWAGVVAALALAYFITAFAVIMRLYVLKNPWYGESTL